MSELSDLQYRHLMWRAGFGSGPLDSIKARTKSDVIENLIDQSKKFQPIDLKLQLPAMAEIRKMSQAQKKELKKLNNNKLQELNYRWIERMSETNAVLKERMVLFWHDHFACNLKRVDAQLDLHNIMRKHALGNFKTLLSEVSKSPAMILFLNNQQNKKGHPNENFAREVMELFTLGRDNSYTEEDIKEAARAFTGWGVNREGHFAYRQRIHDDGSKTILGKTGNFNGDDVIGILLDHPDTAKYICRKVYRYFVNEQVNEQHVEELANHFRKVDYDISSLMSHLFNADWFYNEEFIGNKIKSPIDLLVGMNRQFNMHYEDPKVLLFVQKLLNQMLFSPPNVAGWPGGRHWIDNSTLMLRLKLPSIALNSGVIEWYDKGDMPEEVIDMAEKKFGQTRSKLQRKFKATPDWSFFWEHWQGDQNADALADYFFQRKPSTQASELMSKMSRDDRNDLVVEILSLPEYQMC